MSGTYKLREEIVSAALGRHYALNDRNLDMADICDRRITNAAERLAQTMPPGWRPGKTERSPQ